MIRRQLTDDQWKLIDPFLSIGEYGPYPERLRDQFEGVIWRFRTSSQWQEMPDDETGTLVVIAGAYGPDWFATMREIRHRPEQPHVKCTVDAEPTELSVQEVLVRWATSAEFQQRRHAHGLRRRPRSSRCCAKRTSQPRQRGATSPRCSGQFGLC